MRIRPWLFAGTLLAAGVAGVAVPGAHACEMTEGDRRWLDGALAGWPTVERQYLQLDPEPLPTLVVFDERCRFQASPDADGHLDWRAVAHDGEVHLPDSSRIPPVIASFAAPAQTAAGGFFVMGLPSLWRAGGVTSELGLERLMEGVMFHELMHTRQFYFVNPRLEELGQRFGFGDDITDDSLQRAFEDNPDYVHAYERERDLLFAAAAAESDATARQLAAHALAAMRERRAQWFTGDAAQWTPLDEIFLTMEGLGQWVAYRWFADQAGAEAALPATRRGGRHWSQDEGLALFLVIDRLLPGWQRRAFAPEPETAEALLAAAVLPPCAGHRRQRAHGTRRPGGRRPPARPRPAGAGAGALVHA